MVVGEMPEAVDLLVVGGGPGGYAAALAAARRGRQVVLVDAEGEAGLGGVCVRVGCIPSKALIELADHRHRGRIWTSRQVASDGGEVAMAGFQQWTSGVVSQLRDGVAGLLRNAGVEVRRGYFRFTRADQGVLSDGDDRPPTHLRFRSCVLATGSRPAELPSLPFDGTRVLSSTDVLALRQLPDDLAVVGGGYIGVELGTALSKLGVAVTLIEASPRLLPQSPAEAGAAVARSLETLGATVLLSHRVVADDGQLVTVEGDGGRSQVRADQILIAVGRRPNTGDIGLSALGAETDDAGILEVGPDLMVTDRVAAIGDVTPGPALAHKASAQARVAVANLCSGAERFAPRTVAEVVFSDPEVAHAGLSREAAESLGLVVEPAVFPVAASGRARILGERLGHAEWLVEHATKTVVGATIIGPGATELIGEAALAIEMSARLEDVALTIHPHPTMSELLAESALVGLGEPLHVSAPRR